MPQREESQMTDVKPRQDMVAGFLFYRHMVLLVEKTRPKWQVGLLNAIGGKIEPSETGAQAMDREFREETGLDDVLEWDFFCVEKNDEYMVEFYRFTWPDVRPVPLDRSTNDVGERLLWCITDPSQWYHKIAPVGNLRWLIPMALDWRPMNSIVSVSGDIKTRPSW
jgi:8-oxo-dGTP pyrophosphatase MutT (NUDIX family)